MRIWFTSQYRSVAISIIGVLLTSLVLLLVIAEQGISERTIGASLLVLSFIVFCVSGVLFTIRGIWKWQIQDAASHLRWERGLVIVATLFTVLGLALLQDMMRTGGDSFLAWLGMVAYLFGAVILVVAETAYLNNGEWNYEQVVFYVVLAFLAETALGASLLQTGLVAAWVGWFTIIWNLGWLLVMLVVRPKDIYFPVLHYVAPIVIGVALLASGWL